jgi:hypothetical protein
MESIASQKIKVKSENRFLLPWFFDFIGLSPNIGGCERSTCSKVWRSSNCPAPRHAKTAQFLTFDF